MPAILAYEEGWCNGFWKHGTVLKHGVIVPKTLNALGENPDRSQVR